MTFVLNGKAGKTMVVKVQTENAARIPVRFEPFDGVGAGRIAYVCDQDLVELLETQDEWCKIRSIVVDDVNNVRNYEGWVRKNKVVFIKGYALADL